MDQNIKTSTQLVLSLLVCLVLGALLVTFIRMNPHDKQEQRYLLYSGTERVLTRDKVPAFVTIEEKRGGVPIRVRDQHGNEFILTGGYMLRPAPMEMQVMFKLDR